LSIVVALLADRSGLEPRAGTASRQASDETISRDSVAAEGVRITPECHRRTARAKAFGVE
jgi:hypothetical protein